MNRRIFLAVLAALALAAAVVVIVALRGPDGPVTLRTDSFGTTADGQDVTKYTLATDRGVSVSFVNYGGTVTDVTTPDRNGDRDHIVLGFPTLRDYETKVVRSKLYFGAIIGRYANWIEDGRFRLDGRTYQVPLSDPPNTIHGGPRGFDKRIWDVQPLETSGRSASARLTYTSPDGKQGFPGTLRTAVTYTLTEDGAFSMRYRATTNKDTVVNLSNHLNFNLAGAGRGNVLPQVLQVDANRYTPLDRRGAIPLGNLAPVAGTPFDFRKPTAIGARIREDNEQLAVVNDGYDQNWVLNKRGDRSRPQLAVRAHDPGSGRTLEASTTQPGVQIYTANYLNGGYTGIGGSYERYGAFTLETQHFPNSLNQPNFPSTRLKPGQVYDQTTIFRFGVRQ